MIQFGLIKRFLKIQTKLVKLILIDSFDFYLDSVTVFGSTEMQELKVNEGPKKLKVKTCSCLKQWKEV